MVNLTDEDMAEIYQLLKSNMRQVFDRINDLEKRVIYLETKERVN